MVTAELNDAGNIALTGDLGEHTVPGSYVEAGVWVMPLSWAACQLLRGIFEDDLEVGPQLYEWGVEEATRRIVPAERARTEDDGPEFVPEEPRDDVREYDETVEGRVIVPEEQWWWDIWNGMPEFLNRDISPWKTVKVHFRSRQDLENFSRLVNTKMTYKTPAIWYPEAPAISEQEWRWTDEGEEPPDDFGTTSSRRDPKVAKPAGKSKGKRKAKTSAGDAGLDALIGAIT